MDEVSYNVLGIPQKYRNDIVLELRDNGYIKGVNEVKMMGGASGIEFSEPRITIRRESVITNECVRRI